MYQDYEEYECYGIYDMSDVLTDEEVEENHNQEESECCNSSISMDSLGLSWRDFL